MSDYADGYAAGLQAGQRKAHRLASKLNDAVIASEKAKRFVSAKATAAHALNRPEERRNMLDILTLLGDSPTDKGDNDE